MREGRERGNGIEPYGTALREAVLGFEVGGETEVEVVDCPFLGWLRWPDEGGGVCVVCLMDNCRCRQDGL